MKHTLVLILLCTLILSGCGKNEQNSNASTQNAYSNSISKNSIDIAGTYYPKYNSAYPLLSDIYKDIKVELGEVQDTGAQESIVHAKIFDDNEIYFDGNVTLNTNISKSHYEGSVKIDIKSESGIKFVISNDYVATEDSYMGLTHARFEKNDKSTFQNH